MGNISYRDNQRTLEVIKMCIQIYNETLNIRENVGKFSCMSLANGFMKLTRRENNLNKKTLIDIHCLMELLTEHI